MSDQNSAMDAVRGELNKLAAQVENIVKSMEGKKASESSELLDKLTKELASLRQAAGERAQRAYDAGQMGVEEVGEHVRRNPVTSLLIAFGAGCVMSCLIRHLSR